MRKTLIAALLAAPAVLAWADTASIYQQRTEDGDVVLTDRPSPTATTLRTWQVKTPSPTVARQREAKMQAEADAVSARVQRTIDRQEAEAAADARRRQRAAEREDDLRVAEARYGEGTVLDPYGAAPPLVFPEAYRQGYRLRDDARFAEPQRLGTVYGRSRPVLPGNAPTRVYPSLVSPGAGPRTSGARSPGAAPTTAPSVSPGGPGAVE